MQEHEHQDNRLSQLSDNLRTFIRLGNESGVNNFGIKSPPDVSDRDRGIPQVYVGYFARAYEPSGRAVILAGEPGVNVDEYYNKILELEVPQEVQNLVPDNKKIRQGLEQIVMDGSFPSFALVFGKLAKSQEDIVLLYSIVGVSAKTALKEIQDGLRKGMTKLN